MNALGAFILVALVMIVLLAPRQWALLGMAAGVLYLTQAQQISIAGFNCFAVRFLELAGILRVISRRELSSLQTLNKVDRALLLLYGFTTLVFLLRSKTDQAYAIGMAVDAGLCFFTFRALIEDVAEFEWFLRAFAWLLVPYIVLLGIEHFTRHSPFALLGAPEALAVRDDGSARCAGSFRYASLLGTLGASFLPLYIGLYFNKDSRNQALMGIALCLGIVWFSNSGGPVSATATAGVGWLLWTMRTRMRIVRWAIVVWIGVAALLMKAPVWYLIAKVSDLTGGDGWHRSYLIDVAFQHLNQWWFGGMADELTVDWFPYVVRSTGVADITNTYISFGLNAGLGAIVLFILLLTRSFSSLGEALFVIRAKAEDVGPNGTEYILWGLGVMLAVHVVNWFGVTYWDQTYVLWFLQLAVISTASQECLNPKEGQLEIIDSVRSVAEPTQSMPGDATI